VVLQGATPARFRAHARDALAQVETHAPDRRIVFVKSWNEWAEGNYLEPDTRFGRAFLEALRDEAVVCGDAAGEAVSRAAAV
jgi:hypothetical protein